MPETPTHEAFVDPTHSNHRSDLQPDTRNTTSRPLGARHDYYLELKARGYYVTRCECGNTKHRASVRCMACGTQIMLAARAARYAAFHCACGRSKTEKAVRCRHCANAQNQAHVRGRRNQRINEFCPNGGGNTNPCDLQTEHVHCENCGIPVKSGWCSMCIRELERGAAMTEKQSLKYERAA